MIVPPSIEKRQIGFILGMGATLNYQQEEYKGVSLKFWYIATQM